MELLVILYLAYAHLVHPLETRQHYPLQLDRTDERVIAWEKSVQKYEKKRIEIGEAEQQALRAIYRDIQVAYTNNQVEAMMQAMACVSNRVDNIPNALYRELSGGIEDLFCMQFRACKPRSVFDSLADFDNFVALHTKMALFLGNYSCKRNDYGFVQTAWIEYGTFEVLKRYVDQFHDEGKKDFEAIAQKYLDNWILHIESDQGFIRRMPIIKWTCPGQRLSLGRSHVKTHAAVHLPVPTLSSNSATRQSGSTSSSERQQCIVLSLGLALALELRAMAVAVVVKRLG